jgi:hypothetical protein
MVLDRRVRLGLLMITLPVVLMVNCEEISVVEYSSCVHVLSVRVHCCNMAPLVCTLSTPSPFAHTAAMYG